MATFRVLADGEKIPADWVGRREKPKPGTAIEISGIDVSSKAGTELEHKVRQIVERALGHHEAGGTVRSTRGRTRYHVSVSLPEYPLPLEELTRIEAEILQILPVAGKIGSTTSGLSAGPLEPIDGPDTGPYPADPLGTVERAVDEAPPCVCVGGIPGQEQSLDGILGVPMPVAGVTTQVAVKFPEDVFRLEIQNGARFNLRPTQTIVGLVSEMAWAKEITAWSRCRGRLSSVFYEGAGPSTNWMLLERGCHQAETIVFKKTGGWGQWYDRYHWDPNKFWEFFGGKVVRYAWLRDAPTP